MRYFFLITGILLSLCPARAQSYYSYSSQGSSGAQQVGMAVYYADYLHGQQTAMGEVYRMEEFTAAHKTMPKGTLVKVTRLDNGQSVVVRINDRGPFDPNVIIDLSKAAAMKIGLVKKGRARVRLEAVRQSGRNPVNGNLPGTSAGSSPNAVYFSGGTPATRSTGRPAPSAYNYSSTPNNYTYSNMTAKGNVEPYPTLPQSAGGYAVQLASYRNLDNARNQFRQLEQRGLQNLYIWNRNGYHKILIAPFASKSAAAGHLEQIRRQQLQDGIVVKIK